VTVLLGWFLALGTNAKVNLFHTVLYRKNFIKDIVQPMKRGCQERYHLIRPAFPHNRRYFFLTLQEILSCFKFEKKQFQRLGPKNVESATKDS
jgi:hypothetical protein